MPKRIEKKGGNEEETSDITTVNSNIILIIRLPVLVIFILLPFSMVYIYLMRFWCIIYIYTNGYLVESWPILMLIPLIGLRWWYESENEVNNEYESMPFVILLDNVFDDVR